MPECKMASHNIGLSELDILLTTLSCTDFEQKFAKVVKSVFKTDLRKPIASFQYGIA